MPIVPWTEFIIFEAIRTINREQFSAISVVLLPTRLEFSGVRAIFLNGKEASPHPFSRF
jgi:hypothetical protein